MNKITVKIDGMMCGMCESHVNDAIRRAFPVKKVTSSHAKGETVILTEKPIDEAALLDGCTRWQIFSKITLPLSKPIIIYTVLTAFMSPWLDFIFARVICRANSDQYTVAIGLWKMLEKEYIDSWYTSFAAGAVLISIPIAILFLSLQKFYVDGVSGAVKG